MALNLLTPTFGATVLARNPVIYRFRALDDTFAPYAAQGATAKLSAGAGAKFANGGTLEITYTELDGTTETVVFTATENYTGEDEIPDASFGGSISQYWEAVRIKIQSHHRLSPYFTVTRTGPIGGNSVTLKAKDNSSGWSVTAVNSEGFAVTETDPTDDTTPINYRGVLEVYFERTYKGGNYVLSAQLKNVPDSDGYLSFDISSILDGECRAGLVEPIVPNWSTSDSFLGNNLRRFYVRWTEMYGAPIEAQEWQYDEVRTCMNGGVSQAIFAEGDYLASLDADNSLLTWMPDGRTIGAEQPEYLSFYNFGTDADEFQVEWKWYDVTDGSESAATPALTPLEIGAKEVGIFPIGPSLLGVAANADAYKYAVRVRSSSGAASQWREYYIDRDYYPSERYLQYLNGFGCPECWRCTGVWAKAIDIQRSVAERPLLPDFNELSTDRFQFASRWNHKLTYRTGYMRRSEAEVLQEMLTAEVYDVSEEGHIPLLIESNSFQVTDTEQDLHAYQLDARPRMETRNFSKRNTDNATGAWQEPNGDFWLDAITIPWELP